MNPKSPAAPVAPVLVVIPEWQRISGDGRSTTYEKIKDGRLRAVKDGARTKIDLQYGLAHLRSLPPAQIRSTTKKVSTP